MKILKMLLVMILSLSIFVQISPFMDVKAKDYEWEDVYNQIALKGNSSTQFTLKSSEDLIVYKHTAYKDTIHFLISLDKKMRMYVGYYMLKHMKNIKRLFKRVKKSIENLTNN